MRSHKRGRFGAGDGLRQTRVGRGKEGKEGRTKDFSLQDHLSLKGQCLAKQHHNGRLQSSRVAATTAAHQTRIQGFPARSLQSHFLISKAARHTHTHTQSPAHPSTHQLSWRGSIPELISAQSSQSVREFHRWWLGLKDTPSRREPDRSNQSD